MRKITWSVAALLIAGTTLFGQTNDNNDKYDQAMKEFKTLEHQLDEIVDAIRMDMYYGHLTQDKGMFYINEVLAIKSKNRDIMTQLSAKKFNKIAKL